MTIEKDIEEVAKATTLFIEEAHKIFDITDKRILLLNEKLDKLIAYIIPEKEDNSKFLQEIAKLVVKGKPPRKQPKKKKDETWSQFSGG